MLDDLKMYVKWGVVVISSEAMGGGQRAIPPNLSYQRIYIFIIFYIAYFVRLKNLPRVSAFLIFWLCPPPMFPSV